MNALLPLAHGSIEGIGDLWNGVLHPLRCPSHLLVLVALALFAGQRHRFKTAIIVFLSAAAAGLLFTRLPGVSETPAVFPCALSAIAGALVALRRPLPRIIPPILFGTAGFLLGWDSAPDQALGWTVFKLLLGTWLGLALLVLNLTNYAAMVPKRAWLKIAFRVLGSWITAISILYLALSLRR